MFSGYQHRPSHLSYTAVLILSMAALAAAFSSTAGFAKDDYADPRRKVALVIGISHYAHANKLANPVADARRIAERLRPAGFEVSELIDPTLPQLRDGLAAFLSAAQGVDIALVYYAGHGTQIDGANYLVPADFDGKSTDILSELVSTDEVLSALSTAAKAQIILLDACRDNPFRTRIDAQFGRRATDKGLAAIHMPVVDAAAAKPGESARGLIVGYATQPNDTASDGKGANSPYAIALIHALQQADEDLNLILVRASRSVLADTIGKQRPEHRVALTGPLYLVSRRRPLNCDVLAAEEDNNVSVKGVPFDDLDVAAAEKACRNDLELFPDSPRLKHNLARVLDKAGRDEEAVVLYRQAAESGYDWAQNNLAIMLMNGEGTAPDMAQAIVWLKRSYAQGNRQAIVNFTEHDLSPLFRDIPRITRVLQKALLRTLSNNNIVATARLDEETLRAVEDVKLRAGIRSQGISLQLLDHLDIATEVFNVASR